MSDKESTPGKSQGPLEEEDTSELEDAPEYRTQGSEAFYWQQSRENLISPSGLRMFQLAYRHKDEPYDQARRKIDKEYERTLTSPSEERQAVVVPRWSIY